MSALGQGITGLKPYGGSGSSFQKGPIVGLNKFTRPALSSLTQITTGPSGAWSEPGGASGPIMYHGATAGGGDSYALLGQTVSGNFTKTILIEPQVPARANTNIGMFVGDGTGKFLDFCLFPYEFEMTWSEWNSPTSYNGTFTSLPYNCAPAWMQINFDGTNINFLFSANGIQFDTLYSIALSSTILGTPSVAGMGVNCSGPAPNTLTGYAWDWQ